MPWHHRCDSRCNAFLTEAHGSLSGEDLARGIVEILGDPNFYPEVRVFDDFTRVACYDLREPLHSGPHLQDAARRLRGRQVLLLGTAILSGPGIDSFLDITAHASAHFRIFFDRGHAVSWINKGFSEGECIGARTVRAAAGFGTGPIVSAGNRTGLLPSS